jgi:transposase InsO family protein
MTAPRRPDQNATAERVNGILESAFFLDSTFNSIKNDRRWVERSIYIHNNTRLHLSLGMTIPSLKHVA